MYESPSEIGDDALYSMERTDASVCGSDGVDLDETVLYEEQFAVPMTPTEPSVSEHWELGGKYTVVYNFCFSNEPVFTIMRSS